MRATIVGLSTTRQKLAATLVEVVGVDCLVRERGGRAWGQLPRDTRREMLERIGAAVGGELVVIEVEMTLGGRGSDILASRYYLPVRGVEEDLSGDARELLHEWMADAEGGFDEDEVAFDLAWDLVEPDEEAGGEEPSSNLEDRWAAALVASLVASGGIELRGRLKPTGEVAHHLQDADDDDFAERLLDVLVDSTAVSEVFVDEDELAAALRKTRPRR